MKTSISTRFNTQSASILKGLGYLAPESWNALENIQNAVGWYKDYLETDLLEGRLLSFQKSLTLQTVLKKAGKEERTTIFIDLYNEIRDDLLCYGKVKNLMEIALCLP